MKKIKLLRIIFGILIVVSSCIMIILNNTLGAYRGKVEGTGFVYMELAGAGRWEYDVDDEGNLYFAITTSGEKDGISVYSSSGKYMYTLPVKGHGRIYVRIDEENNILVYDSKVEAITKFDKNGFCIDKKYDIFMSKLEEGEFHMSTTGSPPNDSNKK